MRYVVATHVSAMGREIGFVILHEDGEYVKNEEGEILATKQDLK